jgi:mRNA-degrading endonuclease RelE of RelBE toxin-antitoxin system
LAGPVIDFVRGQAPEPRRRLRQAIRDRAKEKGDPLALEAPLQGYYRLRVGPYRITLRYVGEKTIDCVFAERRGLVYDVFSKALIERLLRGRE